ncbi:stage VI sporulation protein D [Virgibacillus byunsanensis]|uniref:Stage VI sporulation protein D n=1 Tax=Virgibacillus byunsanensis TaxID=570945 RepID=A0ABW3LRP6_9BACI
MSNDRAVFSFDLRESLYFEKGQEVAEMMGISLDPEISIQPFNEYISIRGVIELRGEYQKVATTFEEDEEEDLLHFDDYHSRRYVERVVDTDDNQAEFSHRFPVEISVPTYRVADLNDVTVSIESFDYEVPNQSQLKLSSTIEIHGIQDEVDRDPNYALQGEKEDGKAETFQFELKNKKDLESPEEMEELGTNTLSSPETEKVETKKDEPEKERWKYTKTQSLSEFFKKEPEPQEPQEPPSPDEPSPDLMDLAESDDLYEGMESRSDEVKDVRYLSDMFRQDEDVKYAKMKLCIVQEKDTIETIAERYKVSALQLLKQNRLPDDQISEGQLLYIPFTNK